MKHTRPVSKAPVVAQTTLEVKIDFLLNMIDFGLTFLFQKETRI